MYAESQTIRSFTQWDDDYGDAIHSLDDLRLFEERERERLKKNLLIEGSR